MAILIAANLSSRLSRYKIVDKACEAWMFFANDKDRVASITSRDWATVIS